MTKRELRAMNRNGQRHITIKYDDERDDSFVVELWAGVLISAKRSADTLEEAKDIAREWIEEVETVMSSDIEPHYGVPPAQLPIGRLRDLILELAEGDHDLALMLRHGGVPTAEQFIARVYTDGENASDAEDKYALILGALQEYEKKSQPAGYRQRLDPIGLENLKEHIIALAHWAYAGATEPENAKQIQEVVDHIIDLLAKIGAFDAIPTTDAQTSLTVELLAAATIDLHHWAYIGAVQPEDKAEIEGISNRITDHLDRLGAFDDPDT